MSRVFKSGLVIFFCLAISIGIAHSQEAGSAAMPWLMLLLADEDQQTCTDEICNDGIDNDCNGLTDCEDAACADYPTCNTYTNSLGMSFVLIPGGIFTMGSPDGESEYPIGSGETPAEETGRGSDETGTQVTLTQDFYMQTTEVTQGQWQSVMDSNPSYFTNCGADCPVEQVSWNDVQMFIDELNLLGEGTYRLPTEAEWEYAARAGSITAFANGDIEETTCAYDANLDAMGWYCFNSEVSYDGCYDLSGSGGSSCAGTHPVSGKNDNAWGLYDMHGNLWEWCQDWYGEYADGPLTDPEGPVSGTEHVIRGGSWASSCTYNRSANRSSLDIGFSGIDLGFRLVKQP